MAGPPQRIVLIRHAEKPAVASGVIDADGVASDRCLTPRGRQRAGALATLFAPALGDPRLPLTRPDSLHSPEYESASRTLNHRTYETVLPLSERLGIPIRSGHKEGHEAKLADQILGEESGTSLVCWEHTLLEAIAAQIPLHPDSQPVPAAWPGDRFDLIWLFTLGGQPPSTAYLFTELPQLLHAGDAVC